MSSKLIAYALTYNHRVAYAPHGSLSTPAIVCAETDCECPAGTRIIWAAVFTAHELAVAISNHREEFGQQ